MMTRNEKLALQIAIDCLKIMALPAGSQQEESRLEAMMRQAAEIALKRIDQLEIRQLLNSLDRSSFPS